MRAAISVGLADQYRQSDVDKFILLAEGLVAGVLEGTNLKADDDRVRILGVSIDTPDRDGKEDANICPRNQALFTPQATRELGTPGGRPAGCGPSRSGA